MVHVTPGRRVFLLSSLLLFAVFLLIPQGCTTHSSSQKDQASPEWRLGSSTSLIPEVTPEALRQVRESGIELLEVGWINLKWHVLDPEERLARARQLRADASAADLAIWSTHIPYGEAFDISHPDPEARKQAVALVKEYIDHSIEMGAEQIVLHASEPIEESTRQQRITNSRESLKELSRYISGKGVTIAIESLPPDFLGNSSTEVLAIIRDIDNVAICFDTNHLVPEKPEEFVRAAGKWITTVHISDFDGVQQKHWMPGRGVIDWPLVIDELMKAGYRGPFMYEAVRREGEEHTFRDLKGNYEGLMER